MSHAPFHPLGSLLPGVLALAVALTTAITATAAPPGVWYFNTTVSDATAGKDRVRVVVGGQWQRPPTDLESVHLAWGFLESDRQSDLYPENNLAVTGIWQLTGGGEGGEPRSWELTSDAGFPRILWGPGWELWLEEQSQDDRWTWSDLLDAVEAAWRQTALGADEDRLGLMPIGALGPCTVLSQAVTTGAPDFWSEQTLPHHALASVPGRPYAAPAAPVASPPPARPAAGEAVRTHRFLRWLQPPQDGDECSGAHPLTLFTAPSGPLLSVPGATVLRSTFFDLDPDPNIWFPSQRRYTPLAPPATNTTATSVQASSQLCDLPAFAPLCQHQEALRGRLYAWDAPPALEEEQTLVEALTNACARVLGPVENPEATAYCTTPAPASSSRYRVGYGGPWSLAPGWEEIWDPATGKVRWQVPADAPEEIELRLLDGSMSKIRVLSTVDARNATDAAPGLTTLQAVALGVVTGTLLTTLLGLSALWYKRRNVAGATPATAAAALPPPDFSVDEALRDQLQHLEETVQQVTSRVDELDSNQRVYGQTQATLEETQATLGEVQAAIERIRTEAQTVAQTAAQSQLEQLRADLREDPWQCLAVADPQPRFQALEQSQVRHEQLIADLHLLVEQFSIKLPTDELKRELEGKIERLRDELRQAAQADHERARRQLAVFQRGVDLEHLEELLVIFQEQPDLLKQLHDLARRAPQTTWWGLLDPSGTPARRLSIEAAAQRTRENYTRAADALQHLPNGRRRALLETCESAAQLGLWIDQLWPALKRAYGAEPEDLFKDLPPPSQKEWRNSYKTLWRFAALEAPVFRHLAEPSGSLRPSPSEGELLARFLDGGDDFHRQIHLYFKPPGEPGRLAEVVLALQYIVEAYPIEHLSLDQWKALRDELAAGAQSSHLQPDFHQLVKSLAATLGLDYRPLCYYSSHYGRSETDFIEDQVSAISLADRLGFIAQTESTLVVRLHEPFLFDSETGSYRSGHALVSDA